MSEEIKNFDSVKNQIKITNTELEQKIKDLVNADPNLTFSDAEIQEAVKAINFDQDDSISKTESRLLTQEIRTGKLHIRFDIDNDNSISTDEIKLFTHGIDAINNIVNSKFDNLSGADKVSYAQMQFDADEDGEISEDEHSQMQSIVKYSDYAKHMDLDGDLEIQNAEVVLFNQALTSIENSKKAKFDTQVQDLINDTELNLTDYVNSNGITVTAEDQAKYIIARSKFAPKGNDGEITTELTLNQQIELVNAINYLKLDNEHDINGDLKLSSVEKEIYKKALEDLKEKNLQAFNKSVSDIEIDKGVSKLEATYLHIIDLLIGEKDDLTLSDVQKLDEAIEKNDFALKYDLNGDFEVDDQEKTELKGALQFIYDQRDQELNKKITDTKLKYNVNSDLEAKKIIAQESFDLFNKLHNESVDNNPKLSTEQKEKAKKEEFNLEVFNQLTQALKKTGYNKKLDLNEDSKLTKDEIQTFINLRDEYISKRQAEFASKNSTNEIKKIFDENKDGQLDAYEFKNFEKFVDANNDYDLDKDGTASLDEKKLIQDTFKTLYNARIAQTKATVKNRFEVNGNSTFDNDEKQNFIETYHETINSLKLDWGVYNDLKKGLNNHGKTDDEIEEFVTRYEKATNNLKLDLDHDLLVADNVPELKNKFNNLIKEFENNFTGNLSKEVFDKVDKNSDGKISLTELRKLEEFIEEVDKHIAQHGPTDIRIFDKDFDIDGNLFLTNSEINQFKQVQNTADKKFKDAFKAKSLTEQKKIIKDRIGVNRILDKIATLNPGIEEEKIKKFELEEVLRRDLLNLKHNFQEIEKTKNSIAGLNLSLPDDQLKKIELENKLERHLNKITDIDGSTTLSQDEIDAYKSVIDEQLGAPLSLNSPNYQEIDFTSKSFNSYHSGQDGAKAFAAKIEVIEDGKGVEISGNSWKKMNFNFNITANTVVEFEFKANNLAEIHGIGFDNDNNFGNKATTYYLGGTQPSSSDFLGVGNTYTDKHLGEFKKFNIKLGNSLAGFNMNQLVFMHDDDDDIEKDKTMSTAVFKNIKIYNDPSSTSVFQAAKNIYAKNNLNLTQAEIEELSGDITNYEAKGKYNPKLDINNDGQVTSEEIEVLKILKIIEQNKIDSKALTEKQNKKKDFKDNNFIQVPNGKINSTKLNDLIQKRYDKNNDNQIDKDELKELNKFFKDKETHNKLKDLDSVTDELSEDEKLAYQNFISQEISQRNNAVNAMTEADRDQHHIKYIAELFNIENKDLSNPNQIFASNKKLSKKDLILLDQIIDNKLIAKNLDENKYDLDFDQKVDTNEIEYFKKFRDAYYAHIDSNTGQAGYDKLAFDHFDSNGNGVIDKDEYEKLKKRAEYILDPNIVNKSNKSLDLDETRHISISEENAILDLYNQKAASFQNFYNNTPKEDIAESKIDLDGNGVIDLNEAKYLKQMINQSKFSEKYDLNLDGVVDTSEKNIYSDIYNDYSTDTSSKFTGMSAQEKELEAQKRFDRDLDGELSLEEIEELQRISKNNSYTNHTKLDLDGDFTISAQEQAIYESILNNYTTNKVNEFNSLNNEQKKGLAFLKLRKTNNEILNFSEMKLLKDIVSSNSDPNIKISDSYDLNGDGLFTEEDRQAYEILLNDVTLEFENSYKSMSSEQKQALAFEKFDLNRDDKLDDNELHQLDRLIKGKMANNNFYDLNNNQSFDNLGSTNPMDEMSIYKDLYDKAIDTNKKDFKELFSHPEKLELANKKLKAYMAKITGKNSISDTMILKHFKVDDGPMTNSERNKLKNFLKEGGLELNLNDDHNFVRNNGNKQGAYDINDLDIYVEMLEKMVEENERIKNILNG